MKKYLIIYCLIISVSVLSLLIYVDLNKYHNIERYKANRQAVIDLHDFDYIIDKYNNRDFLTGKVLIKEGTYQIKIDGYDAIDFEELKKRKLSYGAYEPTLEMGLYSMDFLTDFFVESLGNQKSINDNAFNFIKSYYLLVTSPLDEKVTFNPMLTNSHALSDRVIFAALFLSYVKEVHPKEHELIKRLNLDLKTSIYILLNDRFFSWESNHGLMQLRALAQLYLFVKSPELANKIKSTVYNRFDNVANYFIGEDGAVFESASGYWLLIYELLQEIQLFLGNKNPLLDSYTKRVGYFISTYTNNCGYYQGNGDSYSRYRDTASIDEAKNIAYRFSNNMAGAKFIGDSFDYSFYFVGLHTPPNIHKLPEDLSFLIYANKPIINNTGRYSYNTSEIRRKIANSESMHSTVVPSNELSLPLESKIVLRFNNNDSTFLFDGYKIYKKGKIRRNITFNPAKGIITIMDSSMEFDTLVSYYNVSGSVKELFQENTETIKVSTKNNIKIDTTLVSNAPNKISTSERLVVKGNPIIVNFLLPDTINASNFETLSSKKSALSRLYQSKILERKYGSKYSVTKKDIVICILFLCLFTLIYWGIILKYYKSRSTT